MFPGSLLAGKSRNNDGRGKAPPTLEEIKMKYETEEEKRNREKTEDLKTRLNDVHKLIAELGKKD